MKKLLCLMILCLLPIPALGEAIPYLQRIPDPLEMVFSGPGYDEGCVATVREAGVYTIIAEARDGEGNLWGRLKSGLGWVDLTRIRTAAYRPVSAAMAEHGLQSGSAGRFYAAEISDQTSWLDFRANERLTEIRLVAMEMTDAGLVPGATLAAFPCLDEGEHLLAGVVFYGDMSAYGLRCVDAEGRERIFTVCLSGRNGMLLMEEWSADFAVG